MEKPAVIFSEQGFREFLKFIQNIMSTKPEGDDAAADALIKAYMSHTAGEPQEPAQSRRPITTNKYTRRDYAGEYEALTAYMRGNGPLKLGDIAKHMHDNLFWGTDSTQATSQLQDLNNKFGGIIKVGRGLYEMPKDDDIVLKFREPYYSQDEQGGDES